eukprot:TRINITY_DN67952_c0_g1_i2.p1 TRINITY_DN67952_c0_g1~~TRINITY_DN67952_c0_g1_i2.p1  ORF type:complete len:122 (+),score=15.28 TRINITY_DN67952_c0_g1_i2:218-583(+)
MRQLVKTIEYILGTISNTASYLRLWALSLAHAELSEVFLNYTVLPILRSHLPIFLFPLLSISFTLFAGVSFGVLMCMDSLECFLHTLRLHWVEFQDKFFEAEGYLFTPFSFEDASKPFLDH